MFDKSTVWAFNLDTTENWAYWDNAFSPEECAKIIEIGKNKIPKTAAISSYNIVDNAVRESEIAWLYPNDNMEWVYRRVTDIVKSLNSQFFNFNLYGLIEGFQFTKYSAPSGKYELHVDRILGIPVRKLSITIQLSDPASYTGGNLALKIDHDPKIMPKEQGKLVAFPSYILHEVQPVTEGVRYSLVAWVTGEPFK
jgi:PKHD-type hydroxylase